VEKDRFKPPDRQAPQRHTGTDPSVVVEQKSIPVEVRQPEPTAVQLAQRMISTVVTPLSTTVIVFIVTVFILLQREDLRDRLIRLFGSSDLNRTTVAMNDAARRLSRYFRTCSFPSWCWGIRRDSASSDSWKNHGLT
jgi:predicted PurR-regulated permease PerM